MGQERTIAQGQCQTFLSLIGDFRKQRDGMNAQCPRCKTFHVVLTHTERGVADYRGSVRTPGGPIEMVVEVKDGDERFNFADIEVDQWRWIRKWEHRQNGTGWFWILIGTNRVGTKTDYPRQTFLVSRHVLCEVRRQMIKQGGVKNLPLNALAAQTRIATRQGELHAMNLLHDYRCEWHGDDLWLPHPNHLFWRTYNVQYDHPGRPNPSRTSKAVGKNMAAKTRR